MTRSALPRVAVCGISLEAPLDGVSAVDPVARAELFIGDTAGD